MTKFFALAFVGVLTIVSLSQASYAEDQMLTNSQISSGQLCAWFAKEKILQLAVDGTDYEYNDCQVTNVTQVDYAATPPGMFSFRGDLHCAIDTVVSDNFLPTTELGILVFVPAGCAVKVNSAK